MKCKFNLFLILLSSNGPIQRIIVIPLVFGKRSSSRATTYLTRLDTTPNYKWNDQAYSTNDNKNKEYLLTLTPLNIYSLIVVVLFFLWLVICVYVFLHIKFEQGGLRVNHVTCSILCSIFIAVYKNRKKKYGRIRNTNGWVSIQSIVSLKTSITLERHWGGHGDGDGWNV